MAAIGTVTWQHRAYDALTLEQLYAILQLRSEAFVVEQNCTYQDMDGADAQAVHVMGWAESSLVAYARCFPAGIKFAEASIGRVITRATLRGTGAGPVLMQQAIDCVHQQWGAQPIRISAQARLAKFYGKLGFIEASAIYVEDGIPHMRCCAPNFLEIFMISDFKNKTAVLTGAGSGFGLECARIGAKLGMHLVLVDVQQDALDKAAAQMQAAGAKVLAKRVDVSKAAEMEQLAHDVEQRFGAPHFIFNNAGVGSGGMIWENTAKDWEWVIGVNVMGVAHGVRVFTPMMLDAAKKDAAYQGHIVNTASMAGLLNAPNMGVYNVSKHAVVALSETLYQDLRLVTDQISASVLCPFFVPTGISQSHRNRPDEMKQKGVKPTKSQLIGQAMSDKAVTSGKVSAADVAQMVFDAVHKDQFYIYSHPKAIASVQTRLEDIMQTRNPTNPFAHKPELGEDLKKALRAD